jgi:vitamin B12 transporter
MFKKISFFAISFVLFSAGPTFAQSETEPETEPASNMDQIIVTGARTPLTINQLGSAATVITRDDIEQRQVRYVTDLLRAVPGFSISHTGVAGSQTQVRVRGSEANHVLVLIDGVRANDPATGDEFRWEYLTTGDIERVEIVRGPQSSLWGSDAMAAVVHIITRKGNGDPAFNGYVEGGSFDTSNAGLSGTFGGPGWSVSAGIENLETEGSNISRTGTEKDGSDITTASLAVQLNATNAVTLDFSLRVTDAYSQFDPVDFFVTGLPIDGDVATAADSLYAQVGARIGTEDSRVAHRLSARYFDSDNRNLVDGSKASSSASDRTTLMYQADISLGENILALALEHERTTFEQRGEIVFGDPNQIQEMDVTSIIADYQGLSHDRFTWLVSARFDDNSDFDDVVSGRLSLAYDVSNTTTLRGAVGTGYKNPTFTERFGFFPGQFIGNPELKPESSTSFDIGIDQELLDGAMMLQASLFRQDLEDEINGFVFDPMTFMSTAENMPGTSTRSGAELSAQWRPNDSFDMGASYTYTDSKEENALGEEVAEVRRPRHAGALSLGYHTADRRFSAALAADYGGTRTDVFFPPFPEPSETVTLDSYWLLDLTLQYKITASSSLFARGSNLLDEDYEQVYGYQTPGRAAYLGIRLNFGE